MAAADFSLKETKPNVGAGRVSGSEKLTSSLDLVEVKHILFVRVVKARELQYWDNGRSTRAKSNHPFVEVSIGNYKGTTRYLGNKKPINSEWNQVFAFSKERIQALFVDITVKERGAANNDDQFIGKITINVSDIPTRVLPDSSLAPQWYKLEDKYGVTGELMLVAWFGTQADEVLPEAWHSDEAMVDGESIANTRSKVYLSPRLWYLRVNIIEAQDLVARDKNRNPEIYVKAMLGSKSLRTTVSPNKSVNPKWNQDLMFVAAEPFDYPLILTVEDKEQSLGRCVIHLSKVNKRWLPEPVGAKWYNLEQVLSYDEAGSGSKSEEKFASKLNMRISLDGGYHVFDESIHCSSDYRATYKALWTGVIGVLELGIIDASGLVPMKLRDGKRTTDAYCVAKYGPKWVRTRTIVNSLSPKWNEQYTWEVYDPYTVLLIGIFDNCHLHDEDNMHSKDPGIGKLRIRLSTLSTNQIYTYSFPLIALQPSGVKKMGEIQLAVRFTCPSSTNLLAAYARPLLPKMHYTHPLSGNQIDSLKQQATSILALRLSCTEPPLREEVVEYMLDAGPRMWSMRREKVNHQRLMAAFSVFVEIWEWFDQIRKWKIPIANILLIVLYWIVLFHPHLLLPALLIYSFGIGIWQYRKRPRNPTHMDIKLSLADSVNADDLDEELDTVLSSKQGDVLRMRYDRLRSYAWRVMVMVGDLAAQAERLNSVLSSEDPRATFIVVIFCLIGAIFLFFTWIPLEWILLVAGVYAIRPPMFRINVPCVPQIVFRRLSTRTDCML